MDFSYTEEQMEVKALAEKILADQTTPQRLRAVEQGDLGYDERLWADLAQVGLLGVGIDTAHGGMGFGFETLCLLVEEVGRSVAPVPVLPVLVTAASSLQAFGPAPLREHFLPGVARGEQLLSAALVEPGNEDSLHPATVAAADGTGWRLSGGKQCVPFATRAAGILLTARTPEGLAVFMVEPGAAGVHCAAQQVTAGEPQYALTLDQAPAIMVAQGEAAGAMARWMFEATAAALSAMAVGLCDRMLRMTAAYTTEREQFGVPVATFQAVGHQQADSFIDVECLRLVSQQAVSRLARGQDATEAVLVAKAWTGDACHRVSQNSQQCHGGMGVDRDYPLFRYCLWARQIELTCGSSAAALASLGAAIASGVAADAGSP